MDANKLTELRRIGFKIKRTCGLCKHGTFGDDEWGTCAVRLYEHQKHSDTKRHLSIHAVGSCVDKFEVAMNRITRLGSYAEFFE